MQFEFAFRKDWSEKVMYLYLWSEEHFNQIARQT